MFGREHSCGFVLIVLLSVDEIKLADSTAQDHGNYKSWPRLSTQRKLPEAPIPEDLPLLLLSHHNFLDVF